MTDNPYEKIERLPSLDPVIPDTLYRNASAPERPRPRIELEEFSSHFPMELPPREIRTQEDFPGKGTASL